jgi:hypothetical protein
MQEKEADREARLREVASKLFFTLKIKVCVSLYTEMLTYQSPSGTTASVSMK